jgi:hypothetical protein
MPDRAIRSIADGYRRATARPYPILCPAPPRQEPAASEDRGVTVVDPGEQRATPRT